MNGKNVQISFKDEWDQAILRRQFSFVTTVGEIRKRNPTKNEGLCVEIHFDEVPNLERASCSLTRKSETFVFHTIST